MLGQHYLWEPFRHNKTVFTQTGMQDTVEVMQIGNMHIVYVWVTCLRSFFSIIKEKTISCAAENCTSSCRWCVGCWWRYRALQHYRGFNEHSQLGLEVSDVWASDKKKKNHTRFLPPIFSNVFTWQLQDEKGVFNVLTTADYNKPNTFHHPLKKIQRSSPSWATVAKPSLTHWQTCYKRSFLTGDCNVSTLVRVTPIRFF